LGEKKLKHSVINLGVFYAELRNSGISASLDYYEDEEAYVLNVGEPITDGIYKGKSNLQIAPGFLYQRSRDKDSSVEQEILAYTNRVMIFTPDGNPAKPESADDQIVFEKLDGFLHGEHAQIDSVLC
jgi:hypothetical protein